MGKVNRNYLCIIKRCPELLKILTFWTQDSNFKAV